MIKARIGFWENKFLEKKAHDEEKGRNVARGGILRSKLLNLWKNFFNLLEFLIKKFTAPPKFF